MIWCGPSSAAHGGGARRAVPAISECLGSLAGRRAYYLAEADYRHTNESTVIVGTTAKGREGTSWGRILDVLGVIDPHWAENCLLTRLRRGEGPIGAVGEEDRRTLVIEGESASLLAVVSREGSTISANLRNGWDTGTLYEPAKTRSR